ncbi:hypothetical protein [Micromonospora sp. WMMD710]|uniref:hypothetical protein n=1 Tax=Micromonospora sp. WMMD710 TaxID=3016085 RepID=UPI00241648D1|nr:hypothetical protein [Micromonospora sp. WMMD710]MDG4756309.1 hypothetical protein [Micromonospora sp. WMMD710]MDG4762406.1 hypothetical protein [Micromonospora sp. WMMD710]MDG4762452.1 hypothetical protein [Micromonospora sp. WMMD710]MDG4762487.1 hypothetical protein [Micromonospora sp. WMMD710]
MALAAQAIALIAAGLVLVVATVTAPAPPSAEPLRMWLRPATAEERREYERQRLHEEMDRIQQEGVTALHTP